MRISIIIPAFNEEKLILETIRKVGAAVSAFRKLDWEAEIIVCDNNSTDRTAELAREAGAKVVFEPINQISRSRNCGAAAATGEWLIFVDADSHPSEGLLADVAEQIQRGDCIAGGSTLHIGDDRSVGVLTTKLWNFISRTGCWLAGSFIFCSTEAFKAVGGFSDELFAGEELDLAKKLKALGRERGKKIVVLHRHPMLTSARRIRLYSGSEHLRFLIRATFQRRKMLTSREACHPWYDGRR